MAIEKQDDTIKRLEKSSEGTVLALGAIADVLNKMELRFKKQEEDDDAAEAAEEAMAEEEEEEVEKAQLVKEIASSVIKQLVDLQGDKPVEVGKKYKWPMEESDSDDAVEVKPRTATTEVQRPLQAMKLKKHDEEEEEAVEMAYKDHHEEEMEEEIEEEIEAQEEDEVVADYPMDEIDEEEDDEVIEEMRLMRKQMTSLRKMNQQLQKQLDGVGESFQSATDKKADSLMQKMGYRKENSTAPRLVTPQTVSRGDVPIVKAEVQSADVADQLSDLSWSEVWNLRLAKMSGDTDGLPKELLG
jgi:hypothetical protein|tara:strand:+ start:6555 stop:7454 length:900 start_codon:yes stop_codon:yes gene_type:complete